MQRPSYLDASLPTTAPVVESPPQHGTLPQHARIEQPATAPVLNNYTLVQHVTPPQKLRQGQPNAVERRSSEGPYSEDRGRAHDEKRELCQAVVSILGQHLSQLSFYERHREIMEAIRSVAVEPSGALTALDTNASLQAQRHQELLEEISKSPDFSCIINAAQSTDESVKTQNEHLGIIAGRLHSLEGELLHGQRHSQLLDAIANISADPPGLSQILSSAVSTKAHLEAQGQSLATIDQRLRVVENSVTQVNSQQNHAELLGAITGMVTGHTDLSPILAALNANGGAMKGFDQRLQGLERELLQDVNLRQNHAEVLDAIGSVTTGRSPDLIPMLSEVNAAMAHVQLQGQAMDKVERHLTSLEKTGSDQKRALEVLLQSLPENLDKQLLSLKANLKKLGETLQNDLNTLQESLGAELADLRREVHEHRAEGELQLRVLPSEEPRALQNDVMRNMLQASLAAELSELRVEMQERKHHEEARYEVLAFREELSKVEQTTLDAMEHVLSTVSRSHTDLVQCIGSAIASAVHSETSHILEAVKHVDSVSGVVQDMISSKLNTDKLSIDNSMDNSVIMEAVQSLPDPEQIAGSVLEKMRNYEIKVDSSEILQALSKMRQPECELMNCIARDVEAVRLYLERSSGGAAHADMRVIEAIDMAPILDAISQIKIAVAVDGGSPICQTVGALLDSSAEKSSNRASDSFSLDNLSSTSTSAPTQLTIAEQLSSRRRALERSEAEVSPDSKQLSLPSPGPESGDLPTPLVQELADAVEEAPHACICGYCCGTRSALERHLQRFPGDAGHRAAA